MSFEIETPSEILQLDIPSEISVKAILNDEDYTAFREAISADIEKDKELYIAGGDDE